jgi:hypothetical protein
MIAIDAATMTSGTAVGITAAMRVGGTCHRAMMIVDAVVEVVAVDAKARTTLRLQTDAGRMTAIRVGVELGPSATSGMTILPRKPRRAVGEGGEEVRHGIIGRSRARGSARGIGMCIDRTATASVSVSANANAKFAAKHDPNVEPAGTWTIQPSPRVQLLKALGQVESEVHPKTATTTSTMRRKRAQPEAEAAAKSAKPHPPPELKWILSLLFPRIAVVKRSCAGRGILHRRLECGECLS